jgi:hypothetical protein
MCLGAHFMGSAPGPPEHEKYGIDDLRPGYNRTYYVTQRSHRMQKHKFGITYPSALFVGSELVPSEHENTVLMFRTSDRPERTT